MTAGGSAPESVAIVMLTAVGDVVHTLPIVNSLKAAWPDTRISWIIQPGPRGLVEHHPSVDELISFERKRGVEAFRALRRTVRGRRWDVVLDLQTYFKAGAITALLPSPRKIGFDRARARDLNWLFTNERIAPRPRAHMQDELLEFVDHLGLPRVMEWRFGPTDEERARYSALLSESDRPTVAFVIGTSKPEKEWPAERYAAAIDRVAGDLGARVVLVGAKSERELAAAATIERLARHRPINLLEWDLRRLTYLIDRADVLVSPDTGPLHMSVALGTPTVSLMGYTNPKRVGPYRRFPDLLLDAFGDPGEDYPISAKNRPGRMERITVEEVVEKVGTALERYPRGR